KMGATAMTGMVYVDPESGLTNDDLLSAALAADGRPGPFLSRLGGTTFGALPDRSSVVHESPQPYIVSRPSKSRAQPTRTPAGHGTASVALRSLLRGEALARQGRHPAAARVLERARRILG